MANTGADGVHSWHALWAMMVGFFMILLDSTIVAVANPSIMAKLGTGYGTVIWVTSSYLLAYAVPLLVAGRLGDRFGYRNLYLVGLAVFTAASLWCGLSGSIAMLIAARMVQGVGAGLLTPQTLSLITRIFPPERRGVAMSVWGATAGVATLVGPLAGGVLVDVLGWPWIFFVNVPIGIVGIGLAVWLVPVLPLHKHRFDLIGVGLSAVAMFLIVFALQEGQSNGWAPWIWAVMVAGVGLMTGFIYWQSVNPREPLVPLDIFRDRDFSLSNVGVAVIGFAATGMILPLMFYAQAVCGLSPTRSALLISPMAIISGLLAPFVGKIVDRAHPVPVVGFGFSMLAIGLTWLSVAMTASASIWELVLPFIVLGVAMAFIWSPLGATATRNLPSRVAGASSGVYNATRQVGAVLGSAGMASFMSSRINSELPPMPDGPAFGPQGAALQLPWFLREPFAAAMSQSMLLPAFVALFGVAAALFMVGFAGSASSDGRRARAGEDPAAANGTDNPDARTRRVRVRPSAAQGFGDGFDERFDGSAGGFAGGFEGGFDDDDDYVEYTLPPAPSVSARPSRAAVPPARAYVSEDHEDHEDRTVPLAIQTAQPRPARAVEPIEPAHNGFRDFQGSPGSQDFRGSRVDVDNERRFQPVEEFTPRDHRPVRPDEPFFDDPDTYDSYGAGADRASRSGTATPHGELRNGPHRPPRNRHHRPDPDW
jgi:EmrB/QacA subfamily drug resistance transporter